MLTPLDIHNKEFKRGLRGYEVDQVDEFLDEVIKDFETLYKENLDLKDLLQREKDSISRYKEMEDTLQKTMVLAQKMAEEAKRNAEKEAELIIAEAKKRAEQIVEGAHARVLDSTRRQEQLRVLEKQVLVRLKSFLQAQQELVDGFSQDELGTQADDTRSFHYEVVEHERD